MSERGHNISGNDLRFLSVFTLVAFEPFEEAVLENLLHKIIVLGQLLHNSVEDGLLKRAE